MLFNSFGYIFIYLPVVLIFYFLIARYLSFKMAKASLVAASLFFYGWWNPAYLPLLGISILGNYSLGAMIAKSSNQYRRKWILIVGLLSNLALLGYFKYTGFLISNINVLTESHIVVSEIILPLGISFFTFTQIAFLIDTYKNKVSEYGLINYCLFVTYFPHLLAGPIIHHAQMMPQFLNEKNSIINYKNIYHGMVLFIMGLSKKVVIADTFAILVHQGYSDVSSLTFTTAWITTLAYTFQIYFDFSGYTDMAIGASKMFNIDLPMNFDSPYQSLSIREFWHRWHITLSNFLRDYVYIPLGGNRISEAGVYRNLIITFILGGLWHGAGWTYVVWGLMHGMALSVNRFFGKLGISMPGIIAWIITFCFINIAWVFFRVNTIADAYQVVSKLFCFYESSSVNVVAFILLFFAGTVSVMAPNSLKLINSDSGESAIVVPIVSLIAVLAIIAMQMNASHEFIYFQF